MKKSLLSFVTFLLIVVTASAQDFKSDLEDARKAFYQHNINPTNHKAELKAAVAAIDRAIAASDGQDEAFRVWLMKGQIYNEIATQLVTIRETGIGDASELPQVENPALEGFNAFQKARSLAQKEVEIKDVLGNFQGSQINLYNTGVYKSEEGNFQQSFKSFKAVLEAHEMLKKEGEISSIDNAEDYNHQLYLTGMSALLNNMIQEAKPYFQQLYEIKYDNPQLYEAMYKISGEEVGKEAAYEYLEAGRERYPDDISLIFATINHLLKSNQLDKLNAYLESAIQKEPTNVLLYITSGNVHDNLYQKSLVDGDQAKAQEYFNKALEYYEKALQIDENNKDATYSIGSLYYNTAANMTQQLNELSNDFSRDGMNKYEVLKTDVMKQFEKALPYFQLCERLDPNDVNTIIARKEIYARKDEIDISNEFKKRLEIVQNGGKNERPYF